MSHIKFDETRPCSFCGKKVKIACFDADYCIMARENIDDSGETLLDFDACESCLKNIVNSIKEKIRR